MKKIILILSIACLIFAATASAEDVSGCIQISGEWGKSCDSDKSLDIKAKNVCRNYTPYVTVCIERTNGSWDCGSVNKLKTSETRTVNYVCDATGQYEYAACTGGYSECGRN